MKHLNNIVLGCYIILFLHTENLCVNFGTSKVVANISKIYPKDVEAPAGGVDDMTKLSYLHEPGVLQNLKIRYELNEIYVRSPLLYI